MKKLYRTLLLVLIIFIVSACSRKHLYIIRNFSESPAEVMITVSESQKLSLPPEPEVLSSPGIVALKKSDIQNAFTGRITSVKQENNAYIFVVPPGHSADITSLIHELNSQRSPDKAFAGSAISIRFKRSEIIFGNNLAELQRVFKVKTFFVSGPVVYYLDLK